MALVEMSAFATGTLTPPRFVRLSRYAFPSLPSETTSFEGVAPGTSTIKAPSRRDRCRCYRAYPIGGRPVIIGQPAENRAGLEPDDRFAAAPFTGSECVAVAMNGFSIRWRRRRPPTCRRRLPGWTKPSHWWDGSTACRPASRNTSAIAVVAAVRHIDVAAQYQECAALVLGLGREDRASGWRWH